MSTHVYDNLQVEKNFIMHSGGTISSGVTDLKLVPDANRTLRLGLTGASNLKTCTGSMSKTVFISNNLATSVIGTNTLGLFKIAVSQPQQSVGGIKIFVSVTDAGVNQKFDEFMGVIQGNSTPPQIYQLSTLVTGTHSSNVTLSTVTAQAASNGIIPFQYSFPYDVQNNSVAVSCFIEWYGTADVGFSDFASTPILSNSTGLTS